LELITAYHRANLKNCLGSVEKTINELFELRDIMIKEELKEQLEKTTKQSITNVDSFLNKDTIKFKI